MKVKYDRSVCAGWFQCLDHWDELEMNVSDGKADLPIGEETSDQMFVCEVPEGQEADVRGAAKACPTNAIHVYEDGERVFPPTESNN